MTDKTFESLRDRSCPSPLQQLTPKTPKTPQTPYSPFLSNFTEINSPNVGTPNESRVSCYLKKNNKITMGFFFIDFINIIMILQATSSKHRSRADAMLQRARIQTVDSGNKITNLAHSPVQLAKSWGTPIWTPEYTLKFLEKVSVALKLDYATTSGLPGSHSRAKPANTKRLKGEYIKIESFLRNYRPYYQEFKHWPTIYLNSTPGYCPFTHADITKDQNKSVENKNIKDSNNQIEKETKSSKMTRKSRSKQLRTTKNEIKQSSEKQCGYCEICRTEYDILSVHLQSKEHINFIKNGDNFIALDTLINSGANVESFLNANKTAKLDIDSEIFGQRSCKKVSKLFRHDDIELKQHSDMQISAEYIQMNGSNFTPPMMMTRRSNSRRTDSIEAIPTKLPSSKRSIAKSNDANDVSVNVGEISEDDDNEPPTKVRARRESAKRINYAEPKEDEENVDETQSKIQKIRLRGIRWRPPSSDERSSMSQKVVYKVVDHTNMKQTKLMNRQSVGHNDNRKEGTLDSNKESANGGGIKVRICRVRESELSLLTNEADNFMFPRIPSDTLTDEDRQSTSEATAADRTIDLTSESDRTHQYAKAGTSYLSESLNRDLDASNKRKRRNQLEAFLNDNSEYYKFENPDSRLRFQEAPFQPSLIRFDNDVTATRSTMISTSLTPLSKKKVNEAGLIRDSEDGKGAKISDKSKLLKSDIVKMHKFAFERIPSTEPWYEAFQRQDECRERIFEYWGSTGMCSFFLFCFVNINKNTYELFIEHLL